MTATVLRSLSLILVLLVLTKGANLAAGESQLRTWIDRSGKHQTDATFVEVKDGKVTLKKKDGATIKVPLESLSEADQQYVRKLAAEKPQSDPTEATDPFATEVKPSGGKKDSPRAAAPQVMDVVATGAGSNPEEALQNAYSAAIEQAVGVLVDAETLVANDEIVREKILTFSRGFVQKYEEVKHWEKGGVHYVRIRAKVSATKLAERLHASNISMRQLSGDLLYRQLVHDASSEDNAIEMAFRDYRMDKVIKVELLGDPEVIDKDQTRAKLKAKVRLYPDLAAWAKLRKTLVPILGKLAVRRAAFGVECNEYSFSRGKTYWSRGNPAYPYYEIPKLGEEASLLHIFNRVSPSGRQMWFDAFLVRDAVFREVKLICDREHYLSIALVDSKNQMMDEGKYPLKARDDCEVGLTWRDDDRHTLWLTPLLCWKNSARDFSSFLEFEHTFDIKLDRVRDIAKCVARIKERIPFGAEPADETQAK